MLIFLDLDGVLRRAQSPLYKLDADCKIAFEQAMRAPELADAQVVIASSWREAMSLETMRGMFSCDIAPLIVGTTPIARRREGCYRHREVLAYLSHMKQEKHPWIAIDDDASLYPAGIENLLLIDSSKGFDAASALRLIELAGGLVKV